MSCSRRMCCENMRIFVAGPYGDHNPKEIITANVARADKVARDLMAQGHQVYCPHKASWGWEDDPRLTREQYLELDRSFLRYWAEGIIRIPGDSPGADGEMTLATWLGLQVLDFEKFLNASEGGE